MAITEQLKILKQGVTVWNNWRQENPHIKINLTDVAIDIIDLRQVNFNGARLNRAYLQGANLSKANLKDIDFIRTYLTGANLSEADLTGADLNRANLEEANLFGANLVYANLRETNLDRASLHKANLREANLGGAHLNGTNLTEATLSSAVFFRTNLRNANLNRANLTGANFDEPVLSNSKWTSVTLGNSVLKYTDLSEAIDLHKVHHVAPSSLGVETISRSRGRIPREFLRGCGLSDLQIEFAKIYNPELDNQAIDEILYKMHDLRAQQPLQISPLFISYSHEDGGFVDKLESHLNKRGIRFWRDVHDLKSGRIEKQIDRAMRLNPTVLLTLSERSLSSDWVEHEVRTARVLEKEMERDVLCPVALDDSWKSSSWPERIMEQIMEYNILDFSEWKDDSKFEGMFRKLIDGLELFYKG